MIVKTIMAHLVHENVYIFYDEHTHEGVVIDPGSDAKTICSFLEKEQISVKAILLTHGHFDHIGAAQEVKDFCHAPILAAKEEEAMLANPDINYSADAMGRPISLKADRFIEDDELLTFSGILIRCIKTPGHSAGGVCYYCKEEEVLFSGDTLFFGTVGRTDLYLSDTEAIRESIREKLFVLPDSVTVYPGHGRKTTIRHEKEHNPYV